MKYLPTKKKSKRNQDLFASMFDVNVSLSFVIFRNEGNKQFSKKTKKQNAKNRKYGAVVS